MEGFFIVQPDLACVGSDNCVRSVARSQTKEHKCTNHVLNSYYLAREVWAQSVLCRLHLFLYPSDICRLRYPVERLLESGGLRKKREKNPFFASSNF